MSTPSRTEAEGLGDKPSPRPRADLSGAFGPPNRSGGLAGRLARPARRPAETDDATPAEGRLVPAVAEPTAWVTAIDDPAPASTPTGGAEQEVPSSAVVPAAHPSTRPQKKAPRTKAANKEPEKQDNAEGGTVTSIVYLPGDLLERLRRARAATGFTYTQLVLDALDATHQVLADLVAQVAAPRARPAGSLFSGPSSTAAAVQPKVQITLRPRRSDAAVVDQLAASHSISRSQLVTLALTAHLDGS